jgi:hypothetical protein
MEEHNDKEEAHNQNKILFISDGKSDTVWEGNCTTAAMDAENQFYILSEIVEDNVKEYVLQKYNSQLINTDTIKLKSPPKEHSIAIKDIVLYSDRIAIVRIGGIQIFDLSGKVIFEKSYKNIYNATSDSNSLYLTEYPVFGGNINRIFQFDVYKLNETWSKDIQLIQDQIKLLAYNQYESKLYLVLNNRLMSFKNGNLEEVCNFLNYKSGKLVSNAAVSIDETKRITYLQVLFESKDKFVLQMSYPNNQMFLYKPTENITTNKNKGTLNVLLPTHNIALEMIAARFEEANSDVKIKFDYYKESGDISQPDFIQFLNLKILSGEQSWDVVPIIFLSYWQYIDKGIFADMDSLDTNRDLSDSDKYYVNLIDGCRINNKLYYLPTRISFSSFVINMTNENANKFLKDSQNWTWKDIGQIITSQTKDDIKLFKFNPLCSEGSILNMIYSPYISDFFIGEKKETDAKLFEECLTVLSEFEAKSLFADEKQNGLLTISPHSDWSSYIDNSISFYENSRVISVPVVKAGNRRSFTIQEAYAVNSRSTNAVQAFNFIKYIAQDSSWGYSGAVVKADKEYIISNLSGRLQTAAEKVSPFVDSLLSVKSSLNHAEYFDVQVGGIVLKIIDQYRKGLISKEEAAKDIAQRVWLYANE